MKLIFDESHASVQCVYEHVKGLIKDLTYEKGSQLSLRLNNDQIIQSPQSICRYLAQQTKNLYGSSINEQTEIDHWLDFSQNLIKTNLKQLNDLLGTRDYLVGNKLTVADLAIFGALKSLKSELNGYANVSKYFSQLNGKTTAKQAKPSTEASQKSEPKDYSKEGKFVDLPDAEKGKVIVRFPPEASGFLHIGHAKAALLNQFYKKEFEGKLIFRFDDTNPAKENSLYEKVILDDVALLGVEPDQYTRTSDYFDLLLELCEKMIRMGKAYADDTDPDEMKRQREQQVESANRSNSVEKNLELWEEMKKGTEIGVRNCIRAKIDMKAANGCMRDPTIYRCKPEPHLITGDKYKVYPTYDFACPIVDSLENITHALRTTEYQDRNEQYYWVCDALEMRKPYIYGFARFNLQHTVLSKRKLTWFVNERKVDGWDDPRFPTVKGILRRGMTVDALKQFIITQGSSRSVVQMEWDKIWTINKGIIDPKAPRHTAVLKDKTVVVNVIDQTKEESKQIQKHPKNPDVGMKTIWYSPKVLIDYADAETLKKGDTVTFMDWGNLIINDIHMKDGKIESIDAKLNLDNKDFKNTVKLTWLAQTSSTKFTPVKCFHFDYIISKPVLDKDDDFKQYCTHQTKFEFDVLGDAEMTKIKKGDIIQLQRRGYYICDQEFSAEKGQSCVLFNIPDGSKKESPTSYMSITNQVYYTNIVAASLATSSSETSGAKKSVNNNQTSQKKTTTTTNTSSSIEVLLENIKKVGDSIRELKAKKATKETIDSSVKQLLALKEEFKKQTGQDWKPDIQVNTPKMETTKETPSNGTSSATGLNDKIKKVGDEIRDLKAKKAPKDQIDAQVKVLLELKSEYKKVTGQDWKPETSGSAPAAPVADKQTQEKKTEKTQKPQKQQKQQETVDKGDDASQKKTTRLCLEAKKEDNLADWYSQLITKSELIEYYDVSGCYILRPWSYFIWEQIKAKFDADIRKLGVSNCYFPLFVSKSALEREKDHIEDFAPEVAWVTRSGLSDLAEPIAVRPTSETVMYPAYSKWIQSHRDLPMKLNQWNNVVRWEFKNPQPFLRTREFLWQEGHTAFANYEEASQEVYQILDLYADVYKSLLAVPVIKGRKTEKEKFAGADWTTTIEAFISASGRGIQAATSHHLGQNFSKMFEIVYQDPETKQKKYVYQNSWGLTTRTIGILAMVHGDNTGLVLPPRVACHQVVIVPCGITASLSKEDENKLINKCKEFEKALVEADIRVMGDYRDNVSPGWKFNHWELKGVPLRLELGPRDLTNKKFVTVRRDNGVKETHDEAGLVNTIKNLLDNIHDSLYAKAEADLKAHTSITDSWDEFLKNLDAKNIIMAPFCGEKACEGVIKNDSARDAVVEEGAPAMGAKSLCIPLEQPKEITTQKCVNPACSNKAKYYTLFGRSY